MALIHSLQFDGCLRDLSGAAGRVETMLATGRRSDDSEIIIPGLIEISRGRHLALDYHDANLFIAACPHCC
jgi:hypothetical protein